MKRTIETIANELAIAWRDEFPQYARDGGVLGDNTRQLVMEALLTKSFQAVLRLCAPRISMTGEDSVASLQREAERLACQDQYLPTPGRIARGMECFLLALPCSGTTDEFARWLQEPRNGDRMKSKIQDHLALLLDIPVQDVTRLEALPFLLSPATVAALTPDARRGLLHELIGSEPAGAALQFVSQHQRPIPPPAKGGTVVLGEGLWLLAATIKTNWEDEDSPCAQRLSDLASGTLDEDLLFQAEHQWVASTLTLGLPELAFVPQPLSLNDGLMRTLQSHLMSSRLAAYSADHLRDHLRSDELQVPPVVSLECFQNPAGMVVIRAHSTEGPLPTLEVSPHWAFIEGHRTWEMVLMEAFHLTEIPQEASQQPLEDPELDPRDAEGDHPLWKVAHPASRRIH